MYIFLQNIRYYKGLFLAHLLLQEYCMFGTNFLNIFFTFLDWQVSLLFVSTISFSLQPTNYFCVTTNLFVGYTSKAVILNIVMLLHLCNRFKISIVMQKHCIEDFFHSHRSNNDDDNDGDSSGSFNFNFNEKDYQY